MSESKIKSFEDRYKATEEEVKEAQLAYNKSEMARNFRLVYEDIGRNMDQTKIKIERHLNLISDCDPNKILEFEEQIHKMERYKERLQLHYKNLFGEDLK